MILLITLTFCLIACNNDKQKNKDNKNEKIETSEQEKAKEEDVNAGVELINGLPITMLDKCNNFPLTLINKNGSENFNITASTQYTDYFEYVPVVGETPDIEIPEDEPLQKDEISLYAKIFYGDKDDVEDDGILVFGAINESETPTMFQDSKVVFISYYGIGGWELCGVETGFTHKQVKEKIGEPSQELDGEKGKVYEYYMLKDEHTYSLIITFHDDAVYQIELNIDNHPVYKNNAASIDEDGNVIIH